MAENKTIHDKHLDMPFKHKNHTSLKHIGLKLACQESSCKRPIKEVICFYSLLFCPWINLRYIFD